uniref:Uncharacterized protein n=1 Tax=Meloidogyne incognita TaxID=6306 RepID=A0A914L791_MELIC
MRSQRNFENRQLTGGRGGRGFYGQHADNSGVDEQNQQTPPFIPGRGRGFSSSTFSVGYPSNVSSFRGHQGSFSGHAFRGGGSSEQSGQLSYPVVAGRGRSRGALNFARSGSSNLSHSRGYHQPSPQQYDSSPEPIQTRHFNIDGISCTAKCNDNEYRVLCETLNIPFSLEFPKKEVIWFTPEELMVKAREHLDAGDVQQAGGKVWSAFMATTNMVFLNAGVWLASHPALNSLSFFAICACKKFYLRNACYQGERGHDLNYNGGSFDAAEKCINKFQLYVDEYKEFNIETIKEELVSFLEKDEEGNVKKPVKFKEDFIKKFCELDKIVQIKEVEIKNFYYRGDIYNNIKYKIW